MRQINSAQLWWLFQVRKQLIFRIYALVLIESNCDNSKVGIYVIIRNLNVELSFENSVKSFQKGKQLTYNFFHLQGLSNILFKKAKHLLWFWYTVLEMSN